MFKIIEESLTKSYTYTDYRNSITTLLKDNKATGNEQSESLLHYTELNEKRMDRLEKTIAITSIVNSSLKSLKRDYIWLVISEGWCGDAAQLLPIIYKMANLSDKIDLRIVFRDENEELMSHFLTNETKSIPKLIILDKDTLEVLAHFGPRPKGAKYLISAYKARHGSIDETAKTELQLWYFHDKGISTQNEIMNLMTKVDSSAVQKLQE